MLADDGMRLGMRLRVVLLASLLLESCTLYHRVIPRPSPIGVDLNHASPEALAKLPGLSETDAARIVENRPYEVKDDLVRRGVVTREQFAAFSDRVYVGRIGDGGTVLISPSTPTLLAWEEMP
jgi:Helix-hairpin-helix motif